MEQTGARFDGKQFQNPIPTQVMESGAFFKVLSGYFKKHPHLEPAKKPGPFRLDKQALYAPPATGVQVTWLGHSTVLFSIDGKRILTDPVWSQRASPVSFAGPKRFFDVPVALTELPPLDLILLSHDHYDHLDEHTIRFLASKNIPIITMLGVGQRLRNWGVPDYLITELDWWQRKELWEGFVFTALPARHFSGRWINDRFTTLWGSFAIKSPNHNIYFGADSGYFEGFKTIGDALGPFDLALLEIGAYNENWPEIHMGPENAVRVALELKAKLLLPLHWGTFALAFHPWTEPIERLLTEADKKQLPLLVPAPGETRNVNDGVFIHPWWKA